MSYGNRYSGGRSGGDRFGGSSMGSGPKPVEIGKQYNVDVTELSRRGDGVAKVQGFVIFVQGAKVGQKVMIKVDRVGPRFVSASVVGGATSSPAPSEGMTEQTASEESSESSGDSGAADEQA